jgi:hypothetical protein
MQHTIVREGGTVVDDQLETPDGVFSSDGIVYTCAPLWTSMTRWSRPWW